MKNTPRNKGRNHGVEVQASARLRAPACAPERPAEAATGHGGADGLFPHTPVTYEEYRASKNLR